MQGDHCNDSQPAFLWPVRSTDFSAEEVSYFPTRRGQRGRLGRSAMENENVCTSRMLERWLLPGSRAPGCLAARSAPVDAVGSRFLMSKARGSVGETTRERNAMKRDRVALLGRSLSLVAGLTFGGELISPLSALAADQAAH